IGVQGKVDERDDENINPKLATGEVEIVVEDLIIYSEAETTPFEIKEDIETGEDIRLKYRYLDLRRPELQQSIKLRSEFYQSVCSFYFENKFIKIYNLLLITI